MKVSDVPQDDSPGYESERRAVYAQNEDGQFVVASSSGWSVEDAVNDLAVADFSERAADAHRRCLQGLASPLEVHMYAKRMDAPTLAQATGLWGWRVRRHLRPGAFAQLKPQIQQRYSDALGMRVDDIDTLPDNATTP